jgi:crotonobetainyl-CoA:carnitine CoA-transferase CaiB-like acyl-CoA transferase
MSAWTATRSSVEAECILQEAGVPAHHVLTGDSATDDPQVSVREFFVRTKCGDRDTLVASTGLHLASSPAEVGPVPRIGEDTVVVLRDLLGYSEDRVYELLASGAAKQLTAQE